MALLFQRQTDSNHLQSGLTADLSAGWAISHKQSQTWKYGLSVNIKSPGGLTVLSSHNRGVAQRTLYTFNLNKITIYIQTQV